MNTSSTLIYIILYFVGFVFWLWMLIDCISKEKDSGKKVAGILLMIIGGILGAVIYYFAIRRSRSPYPQSPINDTSTRKSPKTIEALWEDVKSDSENKNDPPKSDGGVAPPLTP
jgi:hypothetical protein